MRILAFETSGRCGSVAALIGHRLLHQQDLNRAQRSAQTLAPAIRDLLAAAGWQPRQVQLVAVTLGPGSFTGLRVGVATAKTFAYATGAEVMGVNTLSAIARQAPADPLNRPLAVAIDAGRGEVFTAAFAGPAQLKCTASIQPIDAWLASLEALLSSSGAGIRASGPALALPRIAEAIPAGVELVDSRLWQPAAASVGQQAFAQYSAGQRHDVWTLVPLYLRPSAAEEKAQRELRRPEEPRSNPGQ